VELHGPMQVLQRRKTWHWSHSEHLDPFMQLFSAAALDSAILHVDPSFLDHMSAWMTQNVINECFLLPPLPLKMSSGQQHIYVCHTDLHSACMESIYFAQSFPFPNCLARMWNTLAVDVPTSAAVSVHFMLRSSLSMAWTPSTCLSSVAVASVSPQGASFCMLPPITHGIHLPAAVSYSGKWMPCSSLKRSWISCDVFLSRKWNPIAVLTPCAWNLLAVVLGPLFTWKWRRKYSATFRHSPVSALLAHSAIFHSQYWLPGGTAIQETSEKCGRKECFQNSTSFSLSHVNDQWCTKIFIDKTQHLKEKNWRKET